MFKPGDRVAFDTHPKPENEGDPVVAVRKEGKVVEVHHTMSLLPNSDKMIEVWTYYVKIEGDNSTYSISNPDDLVFIRDGSKPKFSTPQEAMDFLEGKTTNNWVDRGLEELLGGG